VNWTTKLMAVQVLDIFGEGTVDDIVQGIHYAVDEGAKVLNMSMAIEGVDVTALRNAVAYATSRNRVVVAAAGNTPNGTINYPAAYPDVIAVAATDSTDHKTSFSNYASWVDVSAPGLDIYSTYPTYDLLLWDVPLNYGNNSGTSMAAPFVSGL